MVLLSNWGGGREEGARGKGEGSRASHESGVKFQVTMSIYLRNGKGKTAE